MDPFTAAVGANVVANIVANALQAVASVVTRTGWERADDLGRLFYLMEAAFAEELPAITHTELERSWRVDDAFMSVYERLSLGADREKEHQALVDAIESL